MCGVECVCTLIVWKNSTVESTRLPPGPSAIAPPRHRSFHHLHTRQVGAQAGKDHSVRREKLVGKTQC